MLLRHYVGTYQGNELTHNSPGNARPQSFQLAEPLWIDPGAKGETGVRELISILGDSGCKKKKKAATTPTAASINDQ